MSPSLKNIGVAIASFAPTLAAMLAGPMAGTAVQAIEKALNLQPDAGSDSIANSIQGGNLTPDTIALLKIADQKHAEIMGQQGIDIAKINSDHEKAFTIIAAEDRSSARRMQIAQPSFIPAVLSVTVTLAIFGVIIAFMLGVDVQENPVAMQLFGSLTTGWGTVMAYWFGTTRSSSEKNALLAQSVPQSVAPAVGAAPAAK